MTPGISIPFRGVKSPGGEFLGRRKGEPPAGTRNAFPSSGFEEGNPPARGGTGFFLWQLFRIDPFHVDAVMVESFIACAG